jgi:hypothetical protein
MPIARATFLCLLLLAVAAAGALPAGAASSARPCLTKQFRGFQVKKAGSVRVLHAKGSGKAAAAIAAEARKIYPKFKALLRRQPPSDKREKCFHGPDGKLDVYVTRARKIGSLNMPKGVVALVHPYVAKEPCLPRKPVFAVVRPGVRKAILAHEIYHAFQAAFRTKQGCHIYSEWNEALATWAGNYVYPDDNVEHDHKGAMEQPQHGLTIWGYATWVFPLYLTQKYGPDTIRRIEEAKASYRDTEHVDRVIAGGFAERLPDFSQHALNQAPVPGVPGITSTFRQWDGIPHVPPVPALAVPVGEVPVAMKNMTLLGREYRRITIDNPKVRKVEFHNATAGNPNLHVRALVRRADGSWTNENWDGRRTVEFCRDRPGEDVREIVLAYSNSSYDVKAPSTTRVRGADSCALRFRVVSARLEYQTNASADHILCGTQAGRIAWSGSAGADDEEQVVETERGRVDGYLGTDVTGGSSGHHLEGCRYEPGNGYMPCVADMAPRTGSKSVGFSLSGGADDASWKLRWGLESPEVGFVDAGDDECNVHIWGYFDAEAEVREVPRARFMGTAPFTVTFGGSGSAPHTPNNTNATVNLEWSYSLTLQRMG